MAGKILVIRGGAIGDFILTLPAIRLLRDAFPDVHLEIMGYRHIIALAENRFYARGVRSIEYGPLSAFFSKMSVLPKELCDYFAGFDQVISYLFDPDGIFHANLATAGVNGLLHGPPKISDSSHAAEQLALPMEQLALFLESPAAEIFPSWEDLAAAEALLPDWERPLLVLHPGSGSEKKNWPIESWVALIRKLHSSLKDFLLLILIGESDTERFHRLQAETCDCERVRFFSNLPLPVAGALLKKAGRMIGHDSGMSHLAAAAGCRAVLLFGPTDPQVWAPRNPGVTILRDPSRRLERIELERVFSAAHELAAS